MSTALFEPMIVPLTRDTEGALRIGKTRVLLEIVVRFWRAGATPEEIVQAYETLLLSDIYAVVAWCLQNDTAVNEYLAGREQLAAEVQNELGTLRPFRKDLLKTLTERAKESEQKLAAINQ